MSLSPTYTVYTDGSILWNPGGPGGWACRVIGPNSTTDYIGGECCTTNQRMELLAVVEGLQRTPVRSRVLVVSDSAYVVRGFTEGWCKRWEKQRWWTSSGSPVKNLDLWQRLILEVQQRTLQWRHVRGHQGEEHNEAVDGMARLGAEWTRLFLEQPPRPSRKR